MKDVDQRLQELASQQHQVFSRPQARSAGLSPNAQYGRLRSGSLVAYGTNALTFPGVTLSYRGLLMVGILDLGPGALVSGSAAAHLLELDGFGEGPLVWLVERGHRDRSTLGTVNSTARIERLDRVVVDGLPCTSGTMTVVQVLAHGTDDEAGNALDSACRRQLTAVPVVRRRLETLGRAGRAGVARFERIIAAGCVESWLERRFLELLRSGGLPMPTSQRRYTLDAVGVARVDFEFGLLNVVVEVGGRRGYLSFEERQRQERRRNALQLDGKIIYFFTRDDVVLRPGRTLATTAAALGMSVLDTHRAM